MLELILYHMQDAGILLDAFQFFRHMQDAGSEKVAAGTGQVSLHEPEHEPEHQ